MGDWSQARRDGRCSCFVSKRLTSRRRAGGRLRARQCLRLSAIIKLKLHIQSAEHAARRVLKYTMKAEYACPRMNSPNMRTKSQLRRLQTCSTPLLYMVCVLEPPTSFSCVVPQERTESRSCGGKIISDNSFLLKNGDADFNLPQEPRLLREQYQQRYPFQRQQQVEDCHRSSPGQDRRRGKLLGTGCSSSAGKTLKEASSQVGAR